MIEADCCNLHWVAPLISRFRHLQYSALRRWLEQESSIPSAVSHLSLMLRSAQMSGSATPVKIAPDQSIAAHASPADSRFVGAGIGGPVWQDADLYQIVRRKLAIAWNKMGIILAVQITAAIRDVISLATVK